MEYDSDFHRSFMVRTQKNLDDYHGVHEATHLINSLIGLLIVSREQLFDCIPNTPLDRLAPAEWGRVSDWITQPIKCNPGHVHTLTLRQFVRKLRNAVAHFRIEPYPEQGTVEGFSFIDGSFKTKIPEAELKTFVNKLANELAGPQRTAATPC